MLRRCIVSKIHKHFYDDQFVILKFFSCLKQYCCQILKLNIVVIKNKTLYVGHYTQILCAYNMFFNKMVGSGVVK